MLQILLILHIFFAFWLMSHLISSAFWKKRADASGDLDQMAATTQNLVRSDYIFVGPGIIGLLLTGIGLGGLTGWERFQEPWLAASFLLTLLILILWLAVLAPQQRRMARLARQGADGGAPDPGYPRVSKVWNIVGGIITLIPIIILVLMVIKPG